jgi:CheY-like chemotaxis protein
VLIVEDSDDARDLYATYFRFMGYRVSEARDGLEALEAIPRLLPDVIVMDINLPGVDGWEVTRRLRSVLESHEIPVIAVSGLAVPDDTRERGFSAFLAKPCQPVALEAAALEALHRKDRPDGTPSPQPEERDRN